MHALLVLALLTSPSTADDGGTDDSEPSDAARVEFTYGALGYQGSLFQQRSRDPSDARIDVDRHGVELLGGGASASSTRYGRASLFHSKVGRSGVFFGSTPTPTLNDAAETSGQPVPRNGFNFGIFGNGRVNAGAAFGGSCGFALSVHGGGALKAYTRSTIPGNHLVVEAGGAGGLHCHVGPTFVLAQWGGHLNFGVEQVQDVRFQQGNDRYNPGQGNGLVFFPAHGPSLTFVHAGDRLDASLAGQMFWSFGRGRYGGRRTGARIDVAIASRLRNEGLGLAPWYQYDRIEYGDSTKVDAANTREGHTFGVSFVYSRRIDRARASSRRRRR